jgi:hypothetical protein
MDSNAMPLKEEDGECISDPKTNKDKNIIQKNAQFVLPVKNNPHHNHKHS